MKTWPLLLSSLVYVLVALTSDPARGEECRLGDNAALVYWKALADAGGRILHPGFDDALRQRLYSPLEAPLDTDMKKSLDRFESLLAAVHRGAKMPNCDWGIVYDEGPNTLMTHTEGLSWLVRLLVIRARLHFEQREPGAAVDDLRFAICLAQHLGSDHATVGLVIQCRHEEWILDAMAANLEYCDREALANWRKQLSDPPPVEPAWQRATVEKSAWVRWLRKILSNDNDADLREHLLSFAVVRDDDPQNPLRRLCDEIVAARRTGFAHDPSIEMEHLYDMVIHLLKKRPEEAAAAQPTFLAAVLGSGPVGRLCWSNTVMGTEEGIKHVHVRETEYRREIARAMFLAALAGLLDGRAALDAVPDPASGKPFELVERPDGFDLKSAFKSADKPFRMKFQKRLP